MAPLLIVIAPVQTCAFKHLIMTSLATKYNTTGSKIVLLFLESIDGAFLSVA